MTSYRLLRCNAHSSLVGRLCGDIARGTPGLAQWLRRCSGKRGLSISATWNRTSTSRELQSDADDEADRSRYRPSKYDLNPGPWEPFSGATLAILDLFYDTFKGIGEIGSEFVHIPYVGQKRTEKSSSAGEPVTKELPAAAGPSSPTPRPAPVSKSANETIVGIRAAKGLGRIVKAAARSPGTFTVAMAQGAHNAPRMWGDKTVRPQDPITGVVTGVTAGCKVSIRSRLAAWLGLAVWHVNPGFHFC